jgi:hypothetical protein
MSTLASVVLRDTLANRPAAGIAGRTFFDTTNTKLQRDNGSSWDDIAETPAAGGTGGDQMDYVEFTAAVSVTATTAGTANTVVTGSSVAFNGSTPVIIEFYAPFARAPGAAVGDNMSLELYEDGTGIGRIGFLRTPAANSDDKPTVCRRRMTPSNASHTYSIRGWVNAGTGTITAGVGGAAGTTMPGYIRITKAT